MQKVEGLLNVRGLSCEFHVGHRSLSDLDHAGLTIEVRRGCSNVELTRLRVEPLARMACRQVIERPVDELGGEIVRADVNPRKMERVPLPRGRG